MNDNLKFGLGTAAIVLAMVLFFMTLPYTARLMTVLDEHARCGTWINGPTLGICKGGEENGN